MSQGMTQDRTRLTVANAVVSVGAVGVITFTAVLVTTRNPKDALVVSAAALLLCGLMAVAGRPRG